MLSTSVKIIYHPCLVCSFSLVYHLSRSTEPSSGRNEPILSRIFLGRSCTVLLSVCIPQSDRRIQRSSHTHTLTSSYFSASKAPPIPLSFHLINFRLCPHSCGIDLYYFALDAELNSPCLFPFAPQILIYELIVQPSSYCRD